ncbi:ATP-binding protein [Streptomyces sp. NPDC046805]|uniref:ATP-binding protein n=1 Tax=Streptomyces sp. NPDC046805 TaxID=3155134 RepID=UPI0033CE4A61
MSHLRAPAGRTDRREGGRHGRPDPRPVPPLPETHIRPQLLRLAVLPPLAVALSGSAAVLFAVRSTGARPGLTLWAVLAGAVSVTVAGIVIAVVAANRAARSVSDRVGALRRNAARGEADLRALVEVLRRGQAPPQRKSRGGPPDDADAFELLAADLARAHEGAVIAVVQAAQLSSQTGSEQKLEVFVNLARRLQSLVHREITILDEIENEVEDPDLLKGLFHVDHLATRIRRHAENLAVLGGAVSRRQWSNPVSMVEVLRSAIAEVEQYSRVKLVPPIDGELRGHAVADVIHLLAELIENATVFSAPHTQVLLRASLVTAGLAVEVEDRGLGLPVNEQHRMNALLADPDQVNVGSLLADGRIGLYVVSQLARRHGIHVRLQTNIYGGAQAVLVVPQGLLGTTPGVPAVVPQHDPKPEWSGPERGTRSGPVGVQARPQPNRPPGRAEQAGQAGQGRQSGQDGQAERAGRTGQLGRQRASAELSEAGGGRRLMPLESARLGATANGADPAPLPVRGAREARPNPADAVPGARAGDRRMVAENVAAPPPTLGGTAVRGTMGKPRLPRRRAQEHIVPQLRGGPTPRQESETLAGHDPGLMAAFQRGIGLAETQQQMESADTGSTESIASAEPIASSGASESMRVSAAHGEWAHVSPRDSTAAGMGPAHMGLEHMGPDHTGPAELTPAHMDAAHIPRPQHMTSPHMNGPHTDAPHTDMPASPEARAHTSGTDPTAGPDGSAPAG